MQNRWPVFFLLLLSLGGRADYGDDIVRGFTRAREAALSAHGIYIKLAKAGSSYWSRPEGNILRGAEIPPDFLASSRPDISPTQLVLVDAFSRRTGRTIPIGELDPRGTSETPLGEEETFRKVLEMVALFLDEEKTEENSSLIGWSGCGKEIAQ